MYVFEISNLTSNALADVLDACNGQGVEHAFRKNWDGSADTMQIFLAALSGGGITTLLNFLLGLYKQGYVKVRVNGYEVECHKNSLTSVRDFIRNLENLHKNHDS